MTNPLLTRRGFALSALAAGATLNAAQRAPQRSAIAKAIESGRAAVALAEKDAERPAYHFHPPAQWMNDPNGTLYYKGWHHLFYQWNPYGAEWGHMHWGHARSRDLVNWEHLPVALAPSLERGEEHVFSGAAFVAADGRPRIFYTSIGKREPEQWIATPLDDDLIEWDKPQANPVLAQSVHGARKIAEWRDPFLFAHDGHTYMVCGGANGDTSTGGTGAVQLYEAQTADLMSWKHRGAIFELRDRQILNIECPNLFPLEGRWVLITSPNRPCEYYVGDIDWQALRFIPQTHDVLDAGTAYASNISVDASGRTLLWLWGRTETDAKRGWNGVMAMPRKLTIDSAGFLRQTPVVEFDTLRGEPFQHPATALDNTSVKLPERASGDSLCIEASFDLGTAESVGVRVRVGSGDRKGLALTYHRGNGEISLGDARTMLGHRNKVQLRVWLDKGVVEAFSGDGTVALFEPVHARRDELGVELFARGGKAQLEAATVWPMRAARFSLDHFHA